jgi:DMSO/TMAO reductase YedYZ molybdopterin-dependent catalytic subunit
VSTDPAPPVHGRRATVALALTVVLGTALLLSGAEWLARAGAESVLSRALQERTGVLDRPTVQVHGGPVLLQALRGRYDDVAVDSGAVSSGPVRLRDVEAELSGVYLSWHDLLDGNADEVYVEGTVENALLTYDDLDRYLSFTGRRLDAEPAGEGQLRLTGAVDAPGGVRAVSALAEVAPEAGALLVRPTRLDTPAAQSGIEELLLRQRFTFPVPLDPLLFEQGDVGVVARPDGLGIRASGSGVVLGS